MKLITRNEALELGLKRYFTDQPCVNNHLAERYTSNTICIECAKVRYNKHRTKYPEKHVGRSGPWRKANSEKAKQTDLNYRVKNPDKVSDWVRDNREASNLIKRNWSKAHPEVQLNTTNKRRAAKLNSTPTWANFKIIKEIYSKAVLMNKTEDIKYHVNHIIPLQGKHVCGLHVENNLEIITAKENQSLNNYHESDNWQ